MTSIKKVLQLVSIGLLVYLLIDTFTHIDIAPTKNSFFTQRQKIEVDTVKNIDALRETAKGYLDEIRSIHTNISNKTLRRVWILIGVLLIQVTTLMISVSRRKN